MLAPTLTPSFDGLHLKDGVSVQCNRFVDLPTELITAILLRTDYLLLRSDADPDTLPQICRRFKDIIDTSVELQYHIELALDGMMDGPPSPLSTGERLSRLRSLRSSWSTLSWKSKVTVPMPGACYAYEFVGGVFCKTHNIQQHPRIGSRQFSATWLPSSHDPGHTLVREDLGLPTRDFAMDPSQDLIILFRGAEEIALPLVVVSGTLELHIRTISTNNDHPGARLPILRTPVSFPVTSAFIQIVDDIVGMLYCVDPDSPRITLWNWKTGELVVDRSSLNLPPATWDFSFIDSHSIFATCGSRTGSIEIFTFSCDTTSSGASEPGQQPLVHIASLRLPAILPFVRVFNLGTHTGPFLASCPPGKPFTASNEDRIHVLTAQYINPRPTEGPRNRPKFCVFFHNRMLEGYIGRHAEQEDNGGIPVVIPWEEWGPANTRFLPHNGTFQWLRWAFTLDVHPISSASIEYVHGQRVIVPSLVEQGKSRMQVLDFNIRNTPRQNCYTNSSSDSDAESGADSDTEFTYHPKNHTHVELIDYTTFVDVPTIFPEPVRSSLPYREMRRDEMADYSGVMIDDERLVGLKYPAFSNGDMKDIHVFTM
ncbi:hypothetical protein HYDPIDRAFT_30404 [Hydnomerulius pinastri MD-312]|uniref:F-box domain-containing protein n=1 Tax=Hydnomerulius pinastri MD-312 TaxID=994086 RepID=A0A0C9WDF5_9AGAM|nr:hypothetical protein HYDPIDRAFT_30404 [Hydnomerulius pinastri MD-312]